MNRGFRIVYHNSIPLKPELFNFLDQQKDQFCSENSYKCRKDSSAYYRRGLFGYGLDANFETRQEPIYTFKRLSRHRRIFGIVPVSILVPTNSPLITTDFCRCAIHLGGQRVNLSVAYNESDYVTYFETGQIRG
jgi:hypothetical protein